MDRDGRENFRNREYRRNKMIKWLFVLEDGKNGGEIRINNAIFSSRRNVS
jgi:hypothetical protein